ncbi:hypothetical protein [Ectobacillus polymachus]|uniref:hypothetical protein n=1 Tax=Ectobacillus polymachus TaxID=1508806 RepID=UPI003A83D8FA
MKDFEFINGFLFDGEKRMSMVNTETMRILIQDKELDNTEWKTKVNAIKEIINTMDIGSTRDYTGDYDLDIKIFLMLLDSVGNLIKLNSINPNHQDMRNVEVAFDFLKMFLSDKIYDLEQYSNILDQQEDDEFL